jgi:hypothetical protein
MTLDGLPGPSAQRSLLMSETKPAMPALLFKRLPHIKCAEVLTPESPRWEQFTGLLESTGSVWGCDGDAGDHVHRHAKAVMAAMGGIDIEATLAFFESHGGYCDCEILLNVDPW